MIAQVISESYITSGWVLSISVSVVGFLLTILLFHLTSAIKNLTKIVTLHDKQIAIINYKLKIEDRNEGLPN